MDINQMIGVISKEAGIANQHVISVVELLDAGNTVPFIARYRKEATGALDENQIRLIQERLTYLRNLEERKTEVIRLIAEQEKLTDELECQIAQAVKLQEVEDLYRPFRQKRRTRATMAKEKGLEPLAAFIMSLPVKEDPATVANEYINEEKQVMTAEDALQGAMDIIAEVVSDDPDTRKWIRRFTFERGTLQAEKKNDEEAEKNVFEMYYEYAEPIKRIVPHRTLAINRGEKEGILRVRLEVDVESIMEFLEKRYIPAPTAARPYLSAALEDSYKRLIAPAVEREARNELTQIAEEQAIHIFSENLRQLLLQAPIKGSMVLGLDPAYRTGCKFAVVDETGKLHQVGVVYPTPPHNRVEEAKRVLIDVIDSYQIDIIAIGNGTASRETEEFTAAMLRDIDRDVSYIIVNEAGASVYSASKLAGEEFPDLDVAERSAVSIARRLQDPLAELVKIDPKSIGVGQYQHDVSQTRLTESLQFVVESAVNYVGVDVNTASPSLLQHVSGVSRQVANNIVKLREEAGKFSSRTQLKKVPRLGAKTFEQCVGFLRIMEGDNPLDKTPIHPESYEKVEELLQRLQIEPRAINQPESKEKLQKVELVSMAEQLEIGEPTLRDIIDSLLRPGRDPRDELSKPLLMKDVLTIEDLKLGMELQGTIRNVVDFGAFVDVGLKNDGLVHISKLSSSYVKHPLDVVSVGQIVTVWVSEVDVKKMRVGLTMIEPHEAGA
ncbi:RNA-binding transcriptional accessory protein [Ammoniphilus oxalaticus]|uniref:RNA-binding transcriptional accessory protein n=1 Tax=Ammoniphilus oxalaticus TaxID=66863 RepID=A0A419SFP2_9BACL|nr:Tex family protein [Ammoniphilus oxalaticus]RKD22602.1 RNA-binding transcriptional accessory protein [Ammoniphilus oxalaticus]